MHHARLPVLLGLGLLALLTTRAPAQEPEPETEPTDVVPGAFSVDPTPEITYYRFLRDGEPIGFLRLGIFPRDEGGARVEQRAVYVQESGPRRIRTVMEMTERIGPELEPVGFVRRTTQSVHQDGHRIRRQERRLEGTYDEGTLTLDHGPEGEEPTCSGCGEPVPPEATSCPACEAELEPDRREIQLEDGVVGQYASRFVLLRPEILEPGRGIRYRNFSIQQDRVVSSEERVVEARTVDWAGGRTRVWVVEASNDVQESGSRFVKWVRPMGPEAPNGRVLREIQVSTDGRGETHRFEARESTLEEATEGFAAEEEGR